MISDCADKQDRAIIFGHLNLVLTVLHCSVHTEHYAGVVVLAGRVVGDGKRVSCLNGVGPYIWGRKMSNLFCFFCFFLGRLQCCCGHRLRLWGHGCVVVVAVVIVVVVVWQRQRPWHCGPCCLPLHLLKLQGRGMLETQSTIDIEI
jgi:hypothetical protein